MTKRQARGRIVTVSALYVSRSSATPHMNFTNRPRLGTLARPTYRKESATPVICSALWVGPKGRLMAQIRALMRYRYLLGAMQQIQIAMTVRALCIPEEVARLPEIV